MNQNVNPCESRRNSQIALLLNKPANAKCNPGTADPREGSACSRHLSRLAGSRIHARLALPGFDLNRTSGAAPGASQSLVPA